MRLMLSRRSFAKAMLLASVTVVPLQALAQSSGTTEELTVDIAERALAPGTTREAAEAWMRYWKLNSGTFLPGWGSEIKSMPGTVDVLKGWVMYPQDAISVRIISVFIFLDADDRVLGIAASDGYGIE
jgi:hypothetical protein